MDVQLSCRIIELLSAHLSYVEEEIVKVLHKCGAEITTGKETGRVKVYNLERKEASFHRISSITEAASAIESEEICRSQDSDAITQHEPPLQQGPVGHETLQKAAQNKVCLVQQDSSPVEYSSQSHIACKADRCAEHCIPEEPWPLFPLSKEEIPVPVAGRPLVAGASDHQKVNAQPQILLQSTGSLILQSLGGLQRLCLEGAVKLSSGRFLHSTPEVNKLGYLLLLMQSHIVPGTSYVGARGIIYIASFLPCLLWLTGLISLTNAGYRLMPDRAGVG